MLSPMRNIFETGESSFPTKLVYKTAAGKQVSKHEAQEIVRMIRRECIINKQWIEIKDDENYRISFIEVWATTMARQFRFFTEYGENPLKCGALRLAGVEPSPDVLTWGGRMEESTCIITNKQYGLFVEGILNKMQQITDYKFEVKWF